MSEAIDISEQVLQSMTKRILFLPHAIRQMSKPDRMIHTRDIRNVIQHGEIIEEYPEDARGHSCLVLGFIDKKPVHVVCSPKEDYLAVITAYLPSELEWADNYRKRKKQ